MAGSVNKAILIGNLGRDPEVRTFQNGGKVCNLNIATSETWKDRESGERKERTEWHTVAIFNEGLVRIAEQYLRKGSKVYLEGQLETRKWQGGTLTMLDGKSGGSQGKSGGDYSQQPDTGYGAGGQGGSRDMDDEIPFAPCVL